MRGFVLLLLVGCNQIYGLDETKLRFDAAEIDGPGCSDTVFVGPLSESFSTNFDMAQPQVRVDRLELWMQGLSGTGNNNGLFVSRRVSVTEPWGTPKAFGVPQDQMPALSGDGLRLMFVSTGRPGARLWEVTRSTIADEFVGVPQPANGIDPDRGNEVDLSYDGKTIYYLNGDDYFQATRAAFDEPFETPRLVATKVQYPSVSPDGLELFYNDSANSLYRQTRTSLTGAFDSPALVRNAGEDPDMAADGKTLYVHINNKPAILTRDCMK